MFAAIEALAGKTHRAATPADARAFVATAIEGKSAVASNAPFLAECGIATSPACAPGFHPKPFAQEGSSDGLL